MIAQKKLYKVKKYKRLKRRRQKVTTSILIVGVIIFLFSLTLKHPEAPVVDEPEVLLKEDFIDVLGSEAVVLHKEYGLLPSIILAQAILESDWGQSELSAKYHNLFGVKEFGDGPKAYMMTKEYVDGEWIDVKAYFKVYPDWKSSLEDHTLLFVNGVNWNKDLYKDVLEAKDYKTAAYALQEAGYATDPTYADKLIEMIEQYDLDQFDPKYKK